MCNLIKEYAIVILNYNDAVMVVNAINKIKKIDTNINIVIVDNASTDDSVNIIKQSMKNYKNIELIKNSKNTGYAAGNNFGIKYIKKRYQNINYVFIMNPDIEVDRISVFNNMIKCLKEEENLACLTALTIYNGKMKFPNDCAWRMLSNKELFFNGSILEKIFKSNVKYANFKVNERNVAYVDIVQGCFFCIKMKALEQINFMDEKTFLYCEELILSKKLSMHNYKEGVLITEYIKHNHFEKDKKLLKKQNKIFHIKCFRNSRKHIIDNYSNGSKLYRMFAKGYLDFDYYIKKNLIKIGLK